MPTDTVTGRVRTSSWSHALPWLAMAGVTMAALGSILSLPWGLVLGAVILGHAATGVACAAVLFDGHPGARLAAWLLGPLAGYAIGSLGLLALWWLGMRSAWTLPLALWPAALLWPAVRLLRGAVVPPALTRRDGAAVALVLILPVLIVARPFSQVGRAMPDGTAYRAYFTADFVWADAVVAEVAKGDVPPVNPFLRGEPLTYYWLPHLLSAVEYRAWPRHGGAEDVLLGNAVWLGMLFTAFLYGFVRYFASTGAAMVACAVAFTATSFEGSYEIWQLWTNGRPLDSLRNMNIDGLTRGRFSSVIVDGLHRLLLYQATHHAVAYVLGFSAIVVSWKSLAPERRGIAITVGLLLGLSVLFSSMSAIILATVTGVLLLVRLAARRAWGRVIPVALWTALPLLGAVGLSFALRYVDPSGGLIDLGLNRTAATNAGISLVLSLGPMLAAIAGGVLLARRRRNLLVPLLVVAIALTYYFFVDVRDHAHVYVAWRAGHLILIASAALSGALLEILWSRRGWPRVVGMLAVLLLVIAGLPTALVDIYNSQDVANRAMGPGFRWTVVLSPREVEGLRWIRTYTRPDAVVQVEPFVRGRDTWAYIPWFAERRMAAGLPISMVPVAKYERASEPVRALYATADAEAAHAGARRLGIDYLVVGPEERRAYPGIDERWGTRPDLLVPRFGNTAISVFQVAR